METRLQDTEVASRLPYLLIFRAVVATVLLVANSGSLAMGWGSDELSSWLLAIVVSTYVVVLIIGALLRQGGVDPAALSAVHLATAGLTTAFVVEVTGGLRSPFSFLYLIVVLDGAIIGGRSVALAVATTCTVAYGGQLSMQLYGLGLAQSSAAADEVDVLRSFFVHATGFYAVALLSGYLAQLMQSARADASDVRDAFQRVERQQREILSSLPVGVIILGEDALILSANPRARDILGAEDVVGRVAPPVLVEFLASGERLGDVAFDEQELSISRAQVTSVDSTGLTVLVVEDRTEVRTLEREVRLKERLASLGELAAAMAHEIRNPLAGLSGAIELMFSDPSDRAAQSRLERVVHREVARLDSLITEFLSYARPLEPKLGVVSLDVLISDVCAMAEKDDRARGTRVEIEVPTPAHVLADNEQIRQVLWNLLLNAFDASPVGMSVYVSAIKEQDQWRIDVRDHGAGIDPSIRDHLYEPFRTTKPQGTGLGLAMVHRIIENHGGRVRLRDAEEGGTVASVWLDLPEGGVQSWQSQAGISG